MKRFFHAMTRRSPRFGHLPLGLEIAIIVAVKLALLIALQRAFFSAPQAKKMRMPTAAVEQHILAPATPAAPAPSTVTPKGPQ